MKMSKDKMMGKKMGMTLPKLPASTGLGRTPKVPSKVPDTGMPFSMKKSARYK